MTRRISAHLFTISLALAWLLADLVIPPLTANSAAPTPTPFALCFNPAGAPFALVPLRDMLALTETAAPTPTRIPTSTRPPTVTPLPEPSATPQPCTPQTVVAAGAVTAAKLYVRAGPAQTWPTTGSLALGQVVAIAELRDGWARLCQGGWASTDYMRVVTK